MNRYRASLLMCLLPAVVLAAAVFADTTPSDYDWDTAPPSRIHQKLADDKAAALAEKDVIRRMAAGSSEAMNQTDYDVGYYDVFIRVNDTTEFIYGVVTMVAEPTLDGVSSIEVDFQADMTLDSITSPQGVRLFTRAGDVVTVTLNPPYNAGEPFECTFYYHGHPTEGGFQGFSFDVRNGTDVVISSLSEPYFARSWWPCKDRMDDKADSFDIAIEVDTLFYVGSNGTLDSTVYNGSNTHTFFYTVRYPLVTYLFSVAISDYTVWYDEWVYNGGQDTMPIVNAVYPDMYSYSLSHLDVTPYALEVGSGLFGEYPFANEKYGHSNFEWGGAMEHQTMTSTAGSSFGFSEPVIVHEMGHQWWGDMITCESWGHIWLNEGWASYTEALYYEVKDGFQAYKNYMAGMAYSGGGTIYVYDTTSVWNIFHGGLSYDKGAWVCHMLRGVLGDEAFFDGITAYYNSEHQWGSATTEEFRDVFEASSGVELDWFFEDWIYGTYRPNYRYSYYQESSGSSGYDLYLRVE
ncbi:MAG: M1 family metallopeptidase [bacterium]